MVDGDVRALFREYLGNSLADSLAGSGDERYFIAELHVHPTGFAFPALPGKPTPCLS
jgi:hypothetical protein